MVSNAGRLETHVGLLYVRFPSKPFVYERLERKDTASGDELCSNNVYNVKSKQRFIKS